MGESFPTSMYGMYGLPISCTLMWTHHSAIAHPKKKPEMPLRFFGLFPLARSVWQAAPGAEPTMNASYRKNSRSEQASMQSGGLRQGEDDDE